MLFAAVRWSLLAHSGQSLRRKIWSLLNQSGHSNRPMNESRSELFTLNDDRALPHHGSIQVSVE
jgi:hypothetical protein